MATLLLMCDGRDLGTAVGERPASRREWARTGRSFHRATSDPAEMKEFFEPNLYMYDAYPGGIGFSEPLYRVHEILLRKTREMIAGMPVRKGVSVVRRAGGREKREAPRKRRSRFWRGCARDGTNDSNFDRGCGTTC